MVDQIQLVRPAANVLVGGVHEIDSDVVFGAGPSPGLQLVHQGVIAVLVLHRILINARRVDALFLSVNLVRFGRMAHQHVAVFIHRDPVEGRVHVLQDEAVFAHMDRWYEAGWVYPS